MPLKNAPGLYIAFLSAATNKISYHEFLPLLPPHHKLLLILLTLLLLLLTILLLLLILQHL